MADEEPKRWHEDMTEEHGLHGVVALTVLSLLEVPQNLQTAGRVVRVRPSGPGPYTVWILRETADESADGENDWARVDDNPTATGLSVVTYKHRQNEPAGEWLIEHGLDDPAIVLCDETGEVISGLTRHFEGEGRTSVRFDSGPVAGRAQCVGVPVGEGEAP